MLRNSVKWLVASLCGLLGACAIITVNVYFPEKDVKQAYKSLDEMLLKGNGSKSPAGEKPPEEQPAGTEEKKEEIKPQSGLDGTLLNFSLVAVACAEESLADELAVELSSMPEVLKAYDEMRARLPQLNALRDSGAVGETRQGLVKVLDKAKLGGNEALVKAEIDNRKTVITAMAKAIERINLRRQPDAKFNFNDLLARAAAMYADTKREGAKPGWWVEQADGSWVRK
jgi:uncharacterized protein DUF1318